MIELLERWGFAAIGAALVLVAALINRFAPAKRPRIRRALVLYVLFVLLAGTAQILGHLSAPAMATWTAYAELLAGVFAAFTCIELTCLLVFDLFFPAVGVVLVTITSDIIVGLAYIFAVFGVLKIAGVSASSVVTTSAVVSGVLALSLQTTLGNILGGVALQLDGTIHVGDWVQLSDGTQGKVVTIRWRHTVVETRNWDTLIVPNANLLAQNVDDPGQAHGKAGAAPDVGLLQRRLPVRPIACDRSGPRRAWPSLQSRAWPTTPSPASSVTTSRRTVATASRTTPCATG